ncbi:MAG: hypothetical protein ACI4TM_00230 [Candidatus Cryptobacteroides sp.]
MDESELVFDDPDAPLVEEERPELDKKTKELLRIYRQNPSDENYQALYDMNRWVCATTRWLPARRQSCVSRNVRRSISPL